MQHEIKDRCISAKWIVSNFDEISSNSLHDICEFKYWKNYWQSKCIVLNSYSLYLLLFYFFYSKNLHEILNCFNAADISRVASCQLRALISRICNYYLFANNDRVWLQLATMMLQRVIRCSNTERFAPVATRPRLSHRANNNKATACRVRRWIYTKVIAHRRTYTARVITVTKYLMRYAKCVWRYIQMYYIIIRVLVSTNKLSHIFHYVLQTLQYRFYIREYIINNSKFQVLLVNYLILNNF